MSLESLARKFFPYPNYRPFQVDAIRFAYNVIKNKRIGLMSSPCGTGKSISVLTAFFMAREQGARDRLLALTRTRNQLEIYCRELKTIKEYSNASFIASMFKSKQEMCPLVKENPKLREISYTDFLHYCKHLKSGAYGPTCQYFDKTLHHWKPSWHSLKLIEQIKQIGPLLPDEVYEVCYEQTLCPYEFTKILAGYADIIVGNYNYVLSETIRKAILGRAGIKLEEINCVFDEAHALPAYAAGMLSNELSTISILRAKREVKKYHANDFGLLKALHKVVNEIGEETYSKYGYDVEHVIPKVAVISALIKRLNLTDPSEVLDLTGNLMEEGEKIRWIRVEEGKSPVSYFSRCITFLSDWIHAAGAGYVHYAKVVKTLSGRKQIRIGIKCLDPSLTTAILNKLRSVILMSGTLWGMDYYIDILGITPSRVEILELPNPFPPKNRVLLVDKTVTTKYEKRTEEQMHKIADNLQKIIKAIGGRVAIFFPAYEVMEAVLKHLKLTYPYLTERKDTKIEEVFNLLKTNEKCAILGVAHGKISEGVDMTLNGRTMLSGVIIVGLPYPKKTELQNALFNYFKEKFGEKAYGYANEAPCIIALAQSAGRLIRSPEDKGIIVIMDSRTTGKIKQKFPQDWKKEMKSYRKIEKLVAKIQEFQNQVKEGTREQASSLLPSGSL